MERNLEKAMEDASKTAEIIGCILTDRSGLCLGAKGNVSPNSAGIIAAIANQASKLEPLETPIISLQSDSSVFINYFDCRKFNFDELKAYVQYLAVIIIQCLIHRDGPVIGAIFKNIPQ